MKYTFFNCDIEPSCSYCEHGKLASDKNMVLCVKKGIVSKDYSCKKFFYSPLKRIPRRPVKPPAMNKEDFTL